MAAHRSRRCGGCRPRPLPRQRVSPASSLISDGGDTGQGAQETALRAGTPGVHGRRRVGGRSARIVRCWASRPATRGSIRRRSICTSRRSPTASGATPFALRLLANGQLVETRRVVPAADGIADDRLFTVSPDPLNPTVYTAEIVADAEETIAENNARTVLLSPRGAQAPAAGPRRGAGLRAQLHGARAGAAIPGFEVDSVVRKGKNDSGRDTFLVQAGGGRGLDADLRISDDARSAVRLRRGDHRQPGGRVLRAGAAGTARRLRQRARRRAAGARRALVRCSAALPASPLEEVLPVELNDRRGGRTCTSARSRGRRGRTTRSR